MKEEKNEREERKRERGGEREMENKIKKMK